MKKKCNKCGYNKALSNNFRVRRDTGKYVTICNECESEKRKEYYKLNKDIVLEKAAKYRNKNKERIKESMAEYNSRPEVIQRNKNYRVENRKELREKEKKWRLENPEKAAAISKRKHEVQRKKPLNRIRYNVSRAVNLALKRQGSSKAGESTMKYLPYTINDLKIHLEKHFEPWMNWNNYGLYRSSEWKDDDQSTWTWQIDHIIPQSDLPYDSLSHPNFQKCWDLKNLRPYSSKKNCLEGSKRVRHES